MGFRTLAPLLVAACGLTVAVGCGSESAARSSNPSKPDVTGRVVASETFLGFPLLKEVGNAVRTNPQIWASDSPFPLYLEPEKAIDGLRHDKFVAGIIKIFKATEGVGAAGNIVVQTRDAEGAAHELRRQVAMARSLPCPEACTKHTERVDVEGVPGAVGLDVKQVFAQPLSEGGMTFKATHDITIVFTKDAFVYQLFVGGPAMDKKRDQLIAAAQAQYKRIS